jgi:phage FluMu protein Com
LSLSSINISRYLEAKVPRGCPRCNCTNWALHMDGDRAMVLGGHFFMDGDNGPRLGGQTNSFIRTQCENCALINDFAHAPIIQWVAENPA